MIQVRTIGDAEIRCGERRLAARAELAFAFAAYLCVRAGERVSRAHLVEMFWPTANEASGRHSLRQLLYRLRREGLLIEESDDHLVVDAAHVTCDVHEILDDRWPDRADGRPLAAPATFLPSVRRDFSDAFRDWLDAMAARVAAQVRLRALRQLGAASEEGRWGDLLSWADVILAGDPLNEEATLSKAESFVMSGSKVTAIELIDAYIAELGPHATRASLPASVLRKRISDRRDGWGRGARNETRLVGRERLLAELNRRLESAARGSGATTVLTGAPGAGKTRILHELRGVAEIRGFTCVDIRIDASTAGRPLALAVQVTAALIDLPGAAGCAPQAMAVAKRLCLGTPSPMPPHGVEGGDLTPAHISWTLTELLAAVGAERKLLLTIDDLHHADGHSLEVLTACATSLRSHRVALFLTCHAASLGTLSSLGSIGALDRLALAPLSPEAAGELATLLADAHGHGLSDEQVGSIVQAAGGNPLFLRELVALRHESGDPRGLPPSLVSIIDSRLRRFSSAHLRLLRISSLLGPLATIRRLTRALRADPASPSLAEVIEDLEREGIVSNASPASVTLHDCWKSCILQGMSAAVRGALSQECAELLLLDRDDADPAGLLWHAAELFAAAGTESDARECLAQCGDAMLDRGLPQQAEAAFSRGLALCHASGDRVRFLCRLADAQARAGRHRHAVQTAQEALALSTLAHPLEHATHLQLLTTLVDGLFREGLPHQPALDDLAVAVTFPDVPMRIRHYACLVGLRLGYMDAASATCAYFDRIIAESSDASAPSLFGELGRLIHAAESGTSDEVRARCDALGRIALLDQPLFARGRALRYRATALRFLGESAAARALLGSALQISNQLGDLLEAHATNMQLVFMALDEGDLAEAGRILDADSRDSSYPRLQYQQIELRHANARLLLHLERYEDCYNLYHPAIDLVRKDSLARRQLADTACLGLAAARYGEMAVADEMLQITSRLVAQDRPHSQLDFPAEALVQTLRALNREHEAEEAARTYTTRRRALYDRPIAPAFGELRRAILGQGQGSTAI